MRSAFVTCLVLFAVSSAEAQPHFPFSEPVRPPRAVQVMAHRGIHALAPENSLPAILACSADYLEWAQIDVRLTRDGRHVVIHDDSIDRCTDGKGKVADFTLAELKHFDAGNGFAPRFKGTPLQSLEEVLVAARGKVNLCLDCKTIDPTLLVKEILATEMQQQVIVSAQPEMLARVRAAADNKVPTMTRFQPSTMRLDQVVKEVAPAAVEMDASDITAEWCRAFHARGIKVEARVLGTKWDNRATWTTMLDAGVDWFLTDDPAGVRFAEVRRRIEKFPVKISFHRGANRYAPENTLPAIEKAAALGADYIEFDIRPTKDGKYLLLHDSTLDRTTTGKGPIREATSAEVGLLDAGIRFGQPYAGTRVPSLFDCLTAVGKKSHAYLDAKDITPEDLLEAMRKFDLVDRSVVYQSRGYLARLKALEPKVRALPPLRSAAQFDQVAAIGPYGFDTDWKILSPELIAKSHRAGIHVFSDAMGENESVEKYQQAIGWGIDVIQTDHPLRVLRAIELTPMKGQ